MSYKLTATEEQKVEDIADAMEYWIDHGDEIITKKHIDLLDKIAQGKIKKLTKAQDEMLGDINDSIEYWKDHGDEIMNQSYANLIGKLSMKLM